MKYQSTKILELGSCAFRQWKAASHCKYIHGYRLVAKFYFSCNTLDERNWVVDFGVLKELKTILEKQFDHTLVVSADDPLLNDFKSIAASGGCDLRIMPEGVGIEKTAEWCLKHADAFVKKLTSERCWVERVEVWEHEKNSAIAITDNKCGCTKKVDHLHTHTVVAAPAPEIQNTVNTTGNNPNAASVGNKVTSGFSNLFAGTSWGA